MKERKILRGARVLLDEGFADVDVAIQKGRIVEIGTKLEGDVIPCTGMLVPGLIDVHAHAIAGHDTMSGAEAVLGMAKRLPMYGVTSFYPTTMNASVEETRRAVEGARDAAQSARGGACIAGVHMEGPFLGEKYKGAQDASANLLPTQENFERLTGDAGDFVKLITIAPELPGALAFISWAVARGLVVSAGHTDASFETMVAAHDAGLTQVTHLFNGMNPLHHRAPGVPCAGLVLPGLHPQVIADGVHLHPAAVRLALRAADSPLLITDCMAATGMGDGEYDLGGQRVYVAQGQARLASGVLAGSTLTMDRAACNAAHFADIAPEAALRMASLNPASAMHLTDRGRIAQGMRADLCLMDEHLSVCATWVEGNLAYAADA